MPDEAEDAAVAFLSKLDPVTQIEVLRRFEEILQRELDTETSRERRVAAALHDAKRTLGKPPSVEEYKALRREHPATRDGPTHGRSNAGSAYELGTTRSSVFASNPYSRATRSKARFGPNPQRRGRHPGCA